MGAAGSDDPTQHGFTPAAKTAGVVKAYPFLSLPQAGDEIGRFDGYRVLRLLGSGGMGLVFAAEEVSLRRPVAIKILKPELAADPESRERFLREARAAAEITCDHVVTVLRVGEAGGLPFMVMPLLSGETLQSRIERAPPLDVRTALVVARDTAAGLAAAHALNLIHRDIKPANIWLETDGPGGAFKRARILDFGLVRRPHTETSLTSTGFIVGTPNYMSPEQAAGNEVDHRADLFALGCAIYTALTGELPFQGNSAMAVMMALANKTPAPVRAKNPTVPERASELVARLLAKRPDDRPQSARAVVEELDAVVDALSGRAPLPPAAAPPARAPPARTRSSPARATRARSRSRSSPRPRGRAAAAPRPSDSGWRSSWSSAARCCGSASARRPRCRPSRSSSACCTPRAARWR